MGSKLGSYDHLNEDKTYSDSDVRIKVEIKEMVRLIENMNYGVHRFLSELVRQRETEAIEKGWQVDDLANGIKELLNNGCY